MLHKILQLLSLSCRHNKLSRPIAAATSASSKRDSEWEAVTSSGAGHYVVCLDCGRKFAYDWAKMKVIY